MGQYHTPPELVALLKDMKGRLLALEHGRLNGPPAAMSLATSRNVTATGQQALKCDTMDATLDESNLITSAGYVKYQCPATGIYLMTGLVAVLTSATSFFSVVPWQNGVGGKLWGQLSTTGAGVTYFLGGSSFVACNSGDTLEPAFSVGALSTTSLPSDSRFCWFQVQRVA